jgi:hypothetical protein
MPMNAVASAGAVSDEITQWIAVAALLVSVLAVLVPAGSGRQQRLRDDRATRGEMYLELVEIVELHGLWVGDRAYDLAETSHNDFQTEMPHRRTAKPERARRVRARALVSSYGSAAVSSAYDKWQLASFIAAEEGRSNVDSSAAKPLADAEGVARQHLATEVNRQLVRERQWRRS